MPLNAKHPLYSQNKEDWDSMRDFYRGERVVKSKGTTYLPATKSMLIDGMGQGKVGQEVYDAYVARAVFPDYVREAVESYIGLLHQKDATIELPPDMEALRENATLYGEPLHLLLRRINEEQLVTGRLGLLVDLPLTPDPANPMPYIALYIAESITNWDDGEALEGQAKVSLVILDESSFIRNNEFNWTNLSKFRVLMLGNTPDVPGVQTTSGSVYMQGVFENEGGGEPQFVPSDMAVPLLRGQTLEEIPFVFVNSKDIVPTPDDPPLIGLGRMCLTIYRGEADYRQNLFMQGQDTFVITGDRKTRPDDPTDTSPLRTGSGSVIELEAGGTAEYVGVTSEGLAEQRSALENDRKQAENKAGQLVDATGSGQESGEALRTRVAARTATLVQIAKTGAAALEATLKLIARWRGSDETKVKVTPNLEFADFDMTGENLVKLMTARSMGAPISKASLHALMVDQGLTKMDYQTELDTIAEEDAQSGTTGTDAGGNPPIDSQNQV